MGSRHPHPLVHLELHTGDLSGACAFYRQLLGWRTEQIEVPRGTYRSMELGAGIEGGVVECGVRQATWLPYVGVAEVHEATEHAQRLGASVLLEPREGPAGWRSVIATIEGGELALWQPKRHIAKARG
jgi:predicted enzyme related to lactoylglutathione lyase